MKSFLKKIAVSCLGTLSAILIVVLAIAIVTISITKKDKINKTGILHIPISGTISDYNQGSFDFSNFNFSTGALSLWELRNKINAASKDKKIEAIYLEMKSTNISQSATTELMKYLENFKKTGKKIYSYSYYYDQHNYLLSTISDSTYLNPNGGVDLKGYAIYSPFFSNLLEQYDIDINIFYAGKFKGSTEPYRRTNFSAENRMQLSVYLNALHDTLVSTIAKNRNIDPSKIKKAIKDHLAYEADYMLENNLVDDLKYYDEFEKILKRDFNKSDLVPFANYKIPKQKRTQKKIAVVFAEGEINWGEGTSGTIGHESYASIFKKIKEDDNIDAVIIRINSGGGNGYASDLLHREISLVRSSGKKVYASFGAMATSGAYYMAAACDSIFAPTNSLTGSIGVYILLPTADRFLKEKLNIAFDSVTTSANAISYNWAYPINKHETQSLKDKTSDLYDLFLTRVSEGRQISKDSVHQLAQGRIWTGSDAYSKGLIDDFKTLEESILFVKTKAQFENHSLEIYPKSKGKLADKLGANNLQNLKFVLNKNSEKLSHYLSDFQSLNEKPTPQMKLPFVFNVTKQ